jgi:hypothetical protein
MLNFVFQILIRFRTEEKEFKETKERLELRNILELLADPSNVNIGILSTNINNVDKEEKLH